jgi:hypothetical protein
MGIELIAICGGLRRNALLKGDFTIMHFNTEKSSGQYLDLICDE